MFSDKLMDPNVDPADVGGNRNIFYNPLTHIFWSFMTIIISFDQKIDLMPKKDFLIRFIG
jgi:hypothetical protein